MAKAYIIKHKETGVQFIASSGKRVWAGPGHAKNAYNQSSYYHRDEDQEMPTKTSVHPYNGKEYKSSLPYIEQDVWEVCCLDDKEDKSNQALNFLVQCCGRLTDRRLEAAIKKFLEEHHE